MAPQFYTDPRITYQGLGADPNDALSRFFQLKMLAEDRAATREERAEARRMRGIQEREALLRLRELERTASEQAAVRGAMAAGVRPGLQAPQGREGRLGVDIPPSFDRNAALSALSQSEGAHLMPGIEADFAAQDAAQQKARAEYEKLDTQGKIEKLKMEGERLNLLGQISGSIGDQATYEAGIQNALNAGVIDLDTAKRLISTPYNPETVKQFQMQALEAKDQVNAEHQRLTREEQARHNKEQEKRAAVGVTETFPPAVEAQKTRMAKAGRAEPTVTIQTVDAQGNPVTRIVPKVAGSEFAARPPAARAGVAQAQERALPVIQQMESLSKQINLGSGVSAVVTGRARSAMGAANYDTAVAQYEALVAGAVPLVARALGHTGVLTEQDVESTRALFPKVGDSQELADSKWAVVNAIIKGQQQGQPQAGGQGGAAAGATDDVFGPDGTLIGHVVDGKFVPLKK